MPAERAARSAGVVVDALSSRRSRSRPLTTTASSREIVVGNGGQSPDGNSRILERKIFVPLDRVTREATNNGKTRSRGLGPVTARSSAGGRSDRFFRDIHGTESVWHPNIVACDVDGYRDTSGHDDVLRRHWVVVCADRRGTPTR